MPKGANAIVPVRRALLSVSDKSGVVELARALTDAGAEIVSTGGTARTLAEAGISVIEVSDFTGFPEIMDGRVKTLHPKIHGALLGRRDVDDEAMRDQAIAPIDLLAVNLYPFQQTAARAECTLADAVEQIDIGGPAMLRAAAKNFDRVAVLTDPARYADVIDALERDGGLDAEARFALAVAAFNHVARYDAAISNYLSALDADGSRREFPDQSNACRVKIADLRYGENPHQHAALYRDPDPPAGTLVTFKQHQGKPLSFNNISDADAAWECVREFDAPACVIVKHVNPCGVSQAPDGVTAYRRAFACDPQSAFGGIIAFNRPLDDSMVREVVETQFAEVVLAPSVAPGALEAAAAKRNLRVLEIPAGDGRDAFDFRRVGGGLLVQTADRASVTVEELETVSELRAGTDVLDELRFAWRVAAHVKSNAVVCARDGRTLGIGAGQTSRVTSVLLAVQKAKQAGLSLDGAVLASDAFFPFRDGIDAAADAGIRAVIQPAGSIRDPEIIAAANERGLVLVFAPRRHFRH